MQASAKMASSTESSTAPGPNGSSIYERTSNADLEKTSYDSSSEFVIHLLIFLNKFMRIIGQ